MRSFDERSHSFPGYVLGVEGAVGDEPGEFIIAIGKAAQAKHRFRAGSKRKVPGRRSMSYTEEDWIDEDATAHRGPDD